MALPPEEVRVLGSLVEKELTTPQQYPLSLNALMLACNQTSNRDPVVAYDEATTEAAVRSLKQRGLARFVHPSHGRSVLRYEHQLGPALGLDRGQQALLAVLLLRGPQTVGELRTRSERMADFADLATVGDELERLEQVAGGLVTALPRRPGQKEVRYAHLLGEGPPDTDDGTAADGPAPPGDRRPAAADEDGVDELRREVARLRRDLDEVRAALGMDAAGA